MRTKRRLVLLVLAALAAIGIGGAALVGPSDAQTQPRCASHADAQHQGYRYCGTDMLPR